MKNLWRLWQGKTWLKSPPPISTSIFTGTTGLRNIQSSPAPRAPHASNLHRHQASNLHRHHGPPKYPILTSTTGLHARKFSLNNLLSRVRPSSHGARALGQELNFDRRSHFRLARHIWSAVVRAWDRRDVARSPAVRFPMATVFRDFGNQIICLIITLNLGSLLFVTWAIWQFGGTQVRKSDAALLLGDSLSKVVGNFRIWHQQPILRRGFQKLRGNTMTNQQQQNLTIYDTGLV